MAVIGLLRLFGDFLTDIDPSWIWCVGDSPIRSLAQTTDGSLAGNINVQYFKVVAAFSLMLPVSTPGSDTDNLPLKGPVENARIEVKKADRVLRLSSGNDLFREYRIGLGFNPKLPKRREGDGATPEGDCLICVNNPASKYYLSLGISYPNAADANRGLASALISQGQYDQIIQAHRSGTRPPWNTQLGGEIFIHGNGSGADWTRGCIALNDDEMLELFNTVRIGTKVAIEP